MERGEKGCKVVHPLVVAFKIINGFEADYILYFVHDIRLTNNK